MLSSSENINEPQTEVDVSVIVPMFNEQDGLEVLFKTLEGVFSPTDLTYEVVCVNDCSRDHTLRHLTEYAERDPRIKVVSLSRNFGKEVALSAGLDFCTGRCAIPLDADLQDPPGLILRMVELWREGFDVVLAKRTSRQSDSWLKRLSAGGFYRAFNKISSIPLPDNAGDFRLMDRRVVEVVRSLPERNRFMKGLFAWAGFKTTSVTFERPERQSGQTSWNYWKLWNFALDGVTAFSTVPLRIWTYVGLGVSSMAFLYALFLIVRTVAFGIDVPGYASLLVSVLVFAGLQLITLGVIGEYLGRIYLETKQRPLYVVEQTHNLRPFAQESNAAALAKRPGQPLPPRESRPLAQVPAE
ncbi:MAG: glycosyltransferase family 2 protein [Opitutales bacterium]